MRSIAEIQYDFVALLAGELPAEVAHREFEVLWDESNRALIATLGTAQGDHYLALLKDMHMQFVKRFGDPARGGAGRGNV
jgi:hypothetical protein